MPKPSDASHLITDQRVRETAQFLEYLTDADNDKGEYLNQLLSPWPDVLIAEMIFDAAFKFPTPRLAALMVWSLVMNVILDHSKVTKGQMN